MSDEIERNEYEPLEPSDVSTEKPDISPEALFEDLSDKILEPGTVKNITDQEGNVHTISVDLDGTIHELIVYKNGNHEVNDDGLELTLDPTNATVAMSRPERDKPKKVAIAAGVFTFTIAALIFAAKRSRYHSNKPKQ
jgi:hypothetical protein